MYMQLFKLGMPSGLSISFNSYLVPDFKFLVFLVPALVCL